MKYKNLAIDFFDTTLKRSDHKGIHDFYKINNMVAHLQSDFDLSFIEIDEGNITRLNLADKKISHVYKGLPELTNLHRLSLGDNKINDAYGVSFLTNLRLLSLYGNNISDIDFVKPLKKLSFLNLTNNKIENIEPLREVQSLERVFLNDNNIEDLSPLLDLPNLKYFRVHNQALNYKSKKVVKALEKKGLERV